MMLPKLCGRPEMTLMGRSDRAFRECAKAWMPELKRHMDVLERVPESPVRPAQAPKHQTSQTQAPKLKRGIA